MSVFVDKALCGGIFCKFYTILPLRSSRKGQVHVLTLYLTNHDFFVLNCEIVLKLCVLNFSEYLGHWV